MMTDKIAIYITAYNAEKTLRATLDSILQQTYKNYVVYILDNGSTDATFEIVKEYCEEYEFIYCVRNVKNFSGSFMPTLYSFWGKSNGYDLVYYKYDKTGNYIPVFIEWSDWVCFIDSDDTVQPTYLEDMISYAKEHDLDMVTCGWDFVRPNRVDHRVAEKNEVIYKKDFSSRLSYYDKFMGPIWNKLFRTDSMTRNITYYENKFSRLFKEGVYFYGADTAFNYLYLGNDLEKFGIIAKSLYNYNISDESVSRKNFHPMRIIADRRMAEVRLDFLQEIGAEISEANREFIFNIYYKSTRSTMDLLLKDDRYDLEQKMKYFHEMFDCTLMKEAFPALEKRYL